MIVVEKNTTHWLLKGNARRLFRVQGDVVKIQHWEQGYYRRTETLDLHTARRRWAWLTKHGWAKW